MAGEKADERTLEFTPTWSVALVCSVFVIVSLIIVKFIEKIESGFKDSKKKSLLHALDKMKEELMLLGFISLLLTVSQDYVARICIKTTSLEHFTPCHLSDREAPKDKEKTTDSGGDESTKNRRLLVYLANSLLEKAWEHPVRRQLAGGKAPTCPEGKEPIVSYSGLHQLHIFIFVLAVVHVVYSLVAMGLATLKVRSWRAWEEEAQENSHDDMAEMTRTLTIRRQSTFVAYHTSKSWSHNSLMVWVVCFFRQFGICVTRADYLTLRLGFIKNHNTGSKFNFHSYMIRCMEDEFQQIVGISAWLWAFVIAFLLFNVNGTNLYFWMCFIPVVMVLVVGTKLQHIIATLALENAMIKSPLSGAAPAIRPRDELFWFKTPTLLLKLIHFILFQNAFELATFFWFWWQFGLESCLLENKAYVYIRIGLGVLTQILCSYSTLPLYALVTQMGSHYKHSIFQNDVKEKLNNWRKGAKKRAKMGTLSEESSYAGGDHSVQDGSGSTTTEDGSTNPHADRYDSRTGEEIAKDEQRIRELSFPVEGAPTKHLRATSESVITRQDIELAPRSLSSRPGGGTPKGNIQFQPYI